MNAIDLLTSQHREVERLFEKIEGTDDEKECERLFETIADKLALHATIEEKIFYPACLAAQTEEIILEGVEEHVQIKRVLADLMAMDDAEEERFRAALKVLKEEVDHHVGEEEDDMFPRVRRLLDEDSLRGLAGDMMELQAKLEQHGRPRDLIRGETKEAAPLPPV